MKVLDSKQIRQKIRRLSFEILEQNYGEKRLYLAGINNSGYSFAKKLKTALRKVSDTDIELIRLKLNPANPTADDITLSVEPAALNNKVVIIVDDVANTGRTIFYALRPLLDVMAKKVEIAVLIDRKHKSFPIKVDYFGLSLATTMKENIKVNLGKSKEASVLLE